ARRGGPGKTGGRRARIGEGRAIGHHGPGKREREPGEEGRSGRLAEAAGQGPRAEEGPENVEEIVEVEGGRRREELLEKHRRIEEHRVGIGEERLAAGGRNVDE